MRNHFVSYIAIIFFVTLYTYSYIANNDYIKYTYICICINICDFFYSYIIMGLAILILPFLPASNIFFNVGFVLAERILYIPSAGYCLLLAIGLQKFSARFSLSQASLLAYAILILLLFTRSWMRSNQWRNEELLFQSALNVCPLNAKVHYNIAKKAADAGYIEFAKLEYQEALRYV